MDTRDFKNSAKTASKHLAEKGFNVPHTLLLEALSVAFGERNWSTLQAQLVALKAPKNVCETSAIPAPVQPGGRTTLNDLAMFRDTDVMVLARRAPNSRYWVAGAYRLQDIVRVAQHPVTGLADLNQDCVYAFMTSVMAHESEMLNKLMLDNRAKQQLPDWEAHPEEDKARANARRLAEVTQGLTVHQVLRESVIADLVEDVRRRAKKYGFSIADGCIAQELAESSNELLALGATLDEVAEASDRLY
jgi:hypothetical protein